jgi:hypothetical protein
MLMPAGPRERLPAGHLARRVIELAAEMGLPRSGACYRADGQGGMPYDPQMMAALPPYCYCRGRRPARETEMATCDDAGARVIRGGLHPGHCTAAGPAGRNKEAICALLPEPVKARAAGGPASAEPAAGDGTRLKADAAMAASLTQEQPDAQTAGLQAQTGAEFRGRAQDMPPARTWPRRPPATAPATAAAAAAAGGTKEPERPEWCRSGARPPARSWPPGRTPRAGRKSSRPGPRSPPPGRGRRKLPLPGGSAKPPPGSGKRARTDAAGDPIPGTRPVRDTGQDREVKRARQARGNARADHQAAAAPAASPDAKISATGPSSRVMPLKKDGFDQLFNVQALATAQTQVILAIMRHPSPAGVQALPPLPPLPARPARRPGHQHARKTPAATGSHTRHPETSQKTAATTSNSPWRQRPAHSHPTASKARKSRHDHGAPRGRSERRPGVTNQARPRRGTSG